jgi:glucose/arabinose dehydrogenase
MTVIVRGRLDADNNWIDNEELFRAAPEYYLTSGAHYGSRFVFDDEGHLFFSIGERGDMAQSQDLSSPLGKIHRVNDDGSIPADNPFVDKQGAVPSIWSYGHRNPQGLSFDPVTGALWESEHGPSGGDEINVIEPGRNYGWGVISMGLERGITRQSAPGMEQPIAYYNPTLAPSGITFYRGDRYPGWKNDLFVAALAGQQLRRLVVEGTTITHQEVLFDSYGRTRAVEEGPDGLLYVLLQNPTGSGTGLRMSDPSPGIVIRLVPVQ